MTGVQTCALPIFFGLFAVTAMLVCYAFEQRHRGLILGFAAACVLILMLALPPLLSPPDDVHRTAAAMFTISYTCALIVPVLSGIAWDLTGIPATSFIPIGLCGVLLMIPALCFKIRPYQA